jgi:putative membrane-bound dehydrogenase-like protein
VSRLMFSLVVAGSLCVLTTLQVDDFGSFLHAGHALAFETQDTDVSAMRGLEDNLQVPAGFQIELYADDDLAHDIYSMTVDARGRVVVSGAGYVRTLIDSNGDGRADETLTFAHGPATGAQGMFFDGSDLLCVGDGGLLRYRDEDGDGKADGEPELLLSIRTGGEHHAHAIRRGPEGAWYLLAGNDAGISEQHSQGPASFVTRPEAGGLLRLTPDFSRSEVYADGFRNAYDFDLGAGGEVFVYDSDDERDISLPWYRPTRVFQTFPGSHAGWLSRSWKRPNYFFEMPPVVASLGRGSPTGVVCYQHIQFPDTYQQAVFVADWTFGRVLAVPLQLGADGAVMQARPRDFVTGRGEFGFAPTDLEVGLEGDLFISVGGRGTRGGVYRVRWVGNSSAAMGPAESGAATSLARNTPAQLAGDGPLVPDVTDPLDRCLRVPQPLSSWGRATWLPLAKQLGPAHLREAVCDSTRSDSDRCRAIEIMTELYGGLDPTTHGQLRNAPVRVRARAAWSLGIPPGKRFGDSSESLSEFQSPRGDPSEFALLELALKETESLVLLSALESLLAQAHGVPEPRLRRMLVLPLRHSSRRVRQLAARVISQHRERLRPGLLADWESHPAVARRSLLLGLVERPRQVDPEVFMLARGLLAEAETPAEWTECLRLLQLAAGDVGPGQPLPAAFDGYASRLGLGDSNLSFYDFPVNRLYRLVLQRAAREPRREREWEWEWRESSQSQADSASESPSALETLSLPTANRIAVHDREMTPDEMAAFPGDSWRDVCDELGRLAAILSSPLPGAMELALGQLTAESHPTDDLHGLLVAARLSGPVSEIDREKLAVALVQLDDKLESRRLNQDRNWGPRLAELYTALRTRVPDLGNVVLRQPDFGHSAHTWLVRGMSGVDRDRGLHRLIQGIDPETPPYRVVDLVQLVAETGVESHRDWLRSLTDHPATQGAAIVALARQPEDEDRARFVEGLRAWQPGVVRASLRALHHLPPVEDPTAWGLLVRILTKWNRDEQEYELRDQAAQLLQRGTGKSWGFQTGEPGYEPQEDAVSRWVRWLTASYPEIAKQIAIGDSPSQPIDVHLAEIPWEKGDAVRGETVFQRKSCGLCHSGRTALGPDLTGISQRFSRRDLYIAIVDPNRDVSSRYLTTVVETRDGMIYRGAIIYEAVDGLILSTSDLQTIRIERHNIARQAHSPVSLMPTGLLEDAAPRDYADLFAYLRTLVP